LKAACNGDPVDQTSFVSKYMRTFNGKMVVTLESETNQEKYFESFRGLLVPQEPKVSVAAISQ
jgi:hypothetical protein